MKNTNENIEEVVDESTKKTSQLKRMSGETQEISTVGATRFRADLKRGLTDEQVQTRIEEGLVNNIGKGSTKTIFQIIISNIVTVFNLITFAVAAWLISVGAIEDLFFLVIVSANIIVGIVQEIRAKKTIDKLSLLSAPSALVIRNGIEVEIPVNEIVLDDLLVLTAGKQICADCIVKEGGVEVNESLLTGESDALVKKVGSSLFSGSFVVSGTCKAKVEKIGEDSYIEKLSKQAKVYKKPKSKILASLKKIIRIILILLIPITICLFLIHQDHFKEELLDANTYNIYKSTVRRTASLIIAMIPSGLFLTTSVALAVSVLKLAKNKTLVQELYCIEMLARVDVLCLDKTGTITDGSMSVKGIEEINNKSGLSVKQIIALMLGSLNDNNMTSVALEKEFGKSKRVNPVFVVPFSSARKFSAVTLEKYGTFFLGAPEFILKKDYDCCNIKAGAFCSYSSVMTD
jgi:cation-transporting ATPase E